MNIREVVNLVKINIVAAGLIQRQHPTMWPGADILENYNVEKAEWNNELKCYEITIKNVNYDDNKYITIVTPHSQIPDVPIVSTESANGKLRVIMQKFKLQKSIAPYGAGEEDVGILAKIDFKPEYYNIDGTFKFVTYQVTDV